MSNRELVAKLSAYVGQSICITSTVMGRRLGVCGILTGVGEEMGPGTKAGITVLVWAGFDNMHAIVVTDNDLLITSYTEKE